MKKIIIGLLLTIPFNSFSQQPIFATNSGGALYSIDPINCTRRFIGSTGQQGFGDIAFTPNGQLWGILGGQLYHIDTTTANATLIGNTVGAVSLVGLNDTTLLAEYNKKLYGINTNNASSYYIDTIGYQAAGDLTWYDDDLYMTTPLIRIELNSTNTAILNISPVNLAIPTSEGAVTASFIGDYNFIIGFNGPNLIKICQIDGSSQMLCPDLNLGGTLGAASMRLARQIPQPAGSKKDTVICDTITLDAQGGAGASWLWSTGDTTRTIRVTVPGSYRVKISRFVCNQYVSLDTINVAPVKELDLSDASVCDQPVEISAGIYPNYLWSTGETTSSIYVEAEGKYWVTTGSGACMQIDTITVFGLRYPGKSAMPNVFTPNDDTFNDLFSPGGAEARDLKWKIYNRWGQLVYETDDLANAWNGRTNNSDAAEGIYYWVLSYFSECTAGKVTENGTLSLIR